jgi:hypothetical protein
MKKKAKKKTERKDAAQNALSVVEQAIGGKLIAEKSQPESEQPEESIEETKNPAAVALGRLGGLKGGKARAAKLTKEQRSEIAKKAAKTRWAKP